MEVLAELTGVVAEVLAPEGAAVKSGAAVLVVESMKMHHEIQAPAASVSSASAISFRRSGRRAPP